MNKTLSQFALAALALTAAGTASAQSAGTWLAKGGVNNVAPHVKSGDLSAPSIPGTKIDVKSATSAIFTLGYMLTDEVSFEFYAGLPYKHEVVGDGSIKGVGKLGTIKQVSPTLFAQYRFMEASAPFRPYLGLGLTYAYFYGGEGSGTLTSLTNPGGSPTKLSASSAFGVSPQLGATFSLGERWFLDASVIKTFIKNKNTLSTGQTIDTKLDPVSSNLSIGYRF
ncbi:MAG: OmpW family outer membrane protein [Burkholderiaceae bacterium]